MRVSGNRCGALPKDEAWELFKTSLVKDSVTSVTSMFDVALGHTEKSLRKEAINAGYFDPMAQQWSSISLF